MNTDQTKDKLTRFMDAFGGLLDKYEAANPKWMETTLLQMLYGAVQDLRDTATKDAETPYGPFLELRYPVQADWENVEPVYFHVSAEDLADAERTGQALAEGFIAVRSIFLLRHLTREVLIVFKNGKASYKVPEELDKKLAKLPRKEQVRRIEKRLKLPPRLRRIGPFYGIPAGGKRRARTYIVIEFFPCVLDLDTKQAYYPIVIGLDFTGIRAKDLDPGTRAELFKGILEGIKAAIPEENWAFLERPRPEPEARPVTKTEALVKVGLTLGHQEFGKRPRQLGLFDGLLDTTRKEIAEKSIEVIGLDISEAQRAALFAIQKLLTETDYKGNIPGKNIEGDKGFNFSGFLPALQFTPAEYLKAYGLKKKKTARGWEEYSGEERRQALQALVDLTKPFLFVAKWTYPKTVKGKTENVTDRIETIRPLIHITRGYEALTKQEDAALDKGTGTAGTDEKLKAIAIEPAPIVVKGIDRYFVLMPANYAEEIKFLVPHASKFVYRFVRWLIVQAEEKRRHRADLVILEGIQEIAYHLRMDAYIKTNQGKRIRQIITKCYKAAKDLGYLLSYGTVRGQTKDLERLELNPEKFRRAREIAEERERLEETKPA